jgi:hypothetical protein
MNFTNTVYIWAIRLSFSSKLHLFYIAEIKNLINIIHEWRFITDG